MTWCKDCVRQRSDLHGRFDHLEGIQRAVAPDPSKNSKELELCVDHVRNRYESPFPGDLRDIAARIRKEKAEAPLSVVDTRHLESIAARIDIVARQIELGIGPEAAEIPPYIPPAREAIR